MGLQHGKSRPPGTNKARKPGHCVVGPNRDQALPGRTNPLLQTPRNPSRFAWGVASRRAGLVLIAFTAFSPCRDGGGKAQTTSIGAGFPGVQGPTPRRAACARQRPALGPQRPPAPPPVVPIEYLVCKAGGHYSQRVRPAWLAEHRPGHPWLRGGPGAGAAWDACHVLPSAPAAPGSDGLMESLGF